MAPNRANRNQSLRGSEYSRAATWIARLSSWVLAGVFLAAAGSKALALSDFTAYFFQINLLPEFLRIPAAVAVPTIEVACAASAGRP